jgi:hypothetical protein
MKNIITAVVAFITLVSNSQSVVSLLQCNHDNHRLSIEFVTQLVTNPIPNHSEESWRNSTNQLTAYPMEWSYQGQRIEVKFPRVTDEERSLEVVSNTMAVAVLDGKTNVLAQTSVRIGRIDKTIHQVVIAVTNQEEKITFTPAK